MVLEADADRLGDTDAVLDPVRDGLCSGDRLPEAQRL